VLHRWLWFLLLYLSAYTEAKPAEETPTEDSVPLRVAYSMLLKK
jgi:hypothetical protein